MSSSASMTSGAPEVDVPAVELRASVLDAAISLGFRNSVMKRWMFDAVNEADDDESGERSTPALTSPSTSEESSFSPYSLRLPENFAPGQSGSGSNVNVQAYMEPNFASTGNGVTRSVWDEDEDMDSANRKGGLAVRLALAVPPPKNKLRKQRIGGAGANGYDSDAGYVSDRAKKVKTKTKKGMGWRRKEKVEEDEDSDTGYRSDAISGNKKMARKEKNIKGGDGDGPLPLGDDRDPGALLASINASVLPGSSSDIGHGQALGQDAYNLDGYLTDSFSAKRGRTKTKVKPSTSKEKEKGKKTASPPLTGDDETQTNTPTKKRSLFRLMARSASREGGKDRELKSPENDVPPPLPPMPPLPLPIADRFARSGTPTSNNSSTAVTTMMELKIDTGLGLGPGPGLVKSSSSMELSSGSSTIRPFNDSLAPRSDSPWSYRSAPSRMGMASDEVWSRGGSESSAALKMSLDLDLPREENGSTSPFVMVNSPVEGDVGAKGNGNGNEHSTLPPGAAVSPTTGPESGKMPTRLGRLFTFGHSANSASKDGSSKVSVTAPTLEFSLPNPHGEEKAASDPLDVASALTAAAEPTALGAKTRNGQSLFEGRADSPESFIIIGEDGSGATPVGQLVFDKTILSPAPDPGTSTNMNSNEQLSNSNLSYLSPMSNTYGSTSSPSSPTRSGLAARRRAPMNGLDITPTQSRVGTPTPTAEGEDVRNTRASVLAYYQVPPPSPPPTGPLPAPPPGAPGSATMSYFENQNHKTEWEKQMLLSPARAYASRSPSPLGPGAPGARFVPTPTPTASRSPSPGMMMMMAQSVRRGRESPFPTRPVLPPQNSRQLMERVERYKTLYSADGANGEGEGDEEGGDGEEEEEAYASSEEFVDTRSSSYIREARARGEKRVYFDIRKSGEGYGMTPEIEIEDADADADGHTYANAAGDDYLDFGADGEGDGDGDEDDVRYARNALGPSSFQNEDGEEELRSDRRSFASMSVYSRYSMLDEDKSAEVREGFVKRIAALYGGRDRDQEEIPDVPKIPAGLREGVKVASSPYRF